jgi:hypothetical protein
MMLFIVMPSRGLVSEVLQFCTDLLKFTAVNLVNYGCKLDKFAAVNLTNLPKVSSRNAVKFWCISVKISKISNIYQFNKILANCVEKFRKSFC